MKPRSSAEGVVVAAVRARTAAATAGLRPGDRVLAINGHALRDAIDFRFHGGEERLALSVERDGARHALRLARRPGADLGVELEAPRAGEIATCANKCVFCFIHQLPKGMRKSLYVKDDDFRLSFLHGNYITLTDLDEAELTRIVEQRLSPLYVSVHATDPALRWELLGRPRVRAEILPRLERLAKDGIGLVRRCEDGVAGALRRRRAERRPPARPPGQPKSVTLVTGTLYAARLERLVTSIPGAVARVAAVPNRFFGGTVSVAGLLTGEDIARHLATLATLGDAVVVPSVALRDRDGVFLDDMTCEDLAAVLRVPVRVVEPSPRGFMRAVTGSTILHTGGPSAGPPDPPIPNPSCFRPESPSSRG